MPYAAACRGLYNFNGGHYMNAANPGEELGEEQTWSISGTLLYDQGNGLRIKARGNYYEDDDGPAAAVATLGIASHNFGGFPIVNGVADRNAPYSGPPTVAELRSGMRTESVYKGRIRAPLAADIGLNTDLALLNTLKSTQPTTVPPLAYQLSDFDRFGLKRKAYRTSLDASYDVNSDITLSFIGGYNKESWGLVRDFTLSPDPGFTSITFNDIRDFSVEGHLVGKALDGRLFWTIGANYIDIKIDVQSGTYDALQQIWFPTGSIFTGTTTTAAKTKGVFGSLQYDFTDQLSLTLEGRYQSDKIADNTVGTISPGKFNKFLPRAVLDFKPSDSTTLYANYSVGNLPGGFNPEVGQLDASALADLVALAPGASTTFGEERLVNYEIGWKQKALNDQLAFNVAAFYMRRSGEIFSGVEIVPDNRPGAANPNRTVRYNANGATTNILGVEIDATFNVTENLTLQGSLAYIDAKISSFPAGEGSGDFGDIFGPDADVSGQRAPRFPPLLGSMSAVYQGNLNGYFNNWYIRGDLFYTGGFYDSNANVAKSESSVDTNLRLGLKSDKLSVELFVTNVLGEDAPLAVNNFADISYDVRLTPGGLFDLSREGVQVDCGRNVNSVCECRIGSRDICDSIFGLHLNLLSQPVRILAKGWPADCKLSSINQ